MCVFDHPNDSPFFRRPTQVYFYCATQSFLIEDHIEFFLSKSDHIERGYEGLKTKTNSSKIIAKMENFLIFEEKSHSRDFFRVDKG